VPARPTTRSSIALERPGDSVAVIPPIACADPRIANAMTVDVEEYFQVSAFADTIVAKDWDSYESRVEACIDRLLELFAAHGAHCTFFTLGWIAERHRTMIRRIVEAGHELASHGYRHQRATDQTPDQFRSDVRRAKSILEDTGGAGVIGYRAASFSFDNSNGWAHEILCEDGYRYSSSIYPVRHDHYGVPDAPRFPYQPLGDDRIVEFPLSTVRLFNRNIPCAGGGYFRLLPYSVSRWALRRLNDGEARPAVFYLHPWEIDPDQPRQAALRLKTRFRHYVNLGRMERKLGRALSDFSWDRMDRILFAGGGKES
jgi:polysaccharide deacetylase family protein (PEP-CTERM system associated)